MTRSGWTVTVRRWLALGAAAALIPVLAGCEAGNNAPTLDFHYPTDAAGTVVGDLSIRNVFVLGAPIGSNLVKGQNASLFLALVDTGRPDRLLSITAPGSALSVKLPHGGILIPSQKLILLTGPHPVVYLTHLTRTLRSGSSIIVVLHFLRAGSVPLAVPVMPRALHYATYAPAPIPASTAKAHKAPSTPSPSPSPS